MSDILETLAGTCGEDGERPRKIRMMRRSTLGNFHETFRHHRYLNGGEQGHESELREGTATAELAESTPPPFAIFPHSQRSARGTRERKVRCDSNTGIPKKVKPAFGLVYKITFIPNGQGYIGITTQKFKDRMRAHKTCSKCHPEEGCRKLNRKIHAHGWHAFEKRVLYENVPVDVLGAMERIVIGLHGTRSTNSGGGMNLTDGGDKGGFADPEVYARAQEKAKPAKAIAFASAEFKKKVGRGSREAWNSLSPAEHQQRAQKQVNGRHAEFVRRREEKIASLPYERGKYYWERQKRTCLNRIRRRMKKFPERFVGLNPLEDCESWFGRTFEERRRA